MEDIQKDMEGAGAKRAAQQAELLLKESKDASQIGNELAQKIFNFRYDVVKHL